MPKVYPVAFIALNLTLWLGTHAMVLADGEVTEPKEADAKTTSPATAIPAPGVSAPLETTPQITDAQLATSYSQFGFDLWRALRTKPEPVQSAIGGKTAPTKSAAPPSAAPIAPSASAPSASGSLASATPMSAVAPIAAPPQNLVVSPYSIAIALSMAANCLDSAQQASIFHVLGLTNTNLSQINEANSKLRQTLTHNGYGITVNIANAIWVQSGQTIPNSWQQTSEQCYDAPVAPLDFGDPANVKVVNDWISQKTQNKIPRMLNQFSPDTTELIINAIYFEGSWTEPFNELRTKPQDFHRSDKTSKSLRFMHQSGSYRYWKAPNFAVLRLPYRKDRTAMYLILPDADNTLDGILDQLTTAQWQEWLSHLNAPESQQRGGEITIPRFALEYNSGLRLALTALGMSEAFASQKSIIDVRHKARLEVTETGTKAAAATAIGMSRGLPITRGEPFTFTADHPFACLLCDDKTGTILFLCAVYDPQSL